MIKAVVKETDEKMKATLEVTRHELSTLRTGKASLAILEPVRVDYYGTKTPLNQVANLAVPEPRLIVIQPWEPKQISTIERAILEANLGLNPSNDGRSIRVPIPQLTEERRKDLCKKAREMGEKGKVAVRHHRHEGRAALEKMEKDKKISEDDRNEGFEQIQKLHDRFIEDIGKSVTHKEADIMEV
jgi:ribosome recycling factor